MGFCHNGHDLDVVGVHRSYERRYGYEKLTLEVCNACHTRLAKREVDRRQQRHEASQASLVNRILWLGDQLEKVREDQKPEIRAEIAQLQRRIQ